MDGQDSLFFETCFCSAMICEGAFSSSESEGDTKAISHWPKSSGPLCHTSCAKEHPQSKLQAVLGL